MKEKQKKTREKKAGKKVKNRKDSGYAALSWRNYELLNRVLTNFGHRDGHNSCHNYKVMIYSSIVKLDMPNKDMSLIKTDIC